MIWTATILCSHSRAGSAHGSNLLSMIYCWTLRCQWRRPCYATKDQLNVLEPYGNGGKAAGRLLNS